MFECFYFIFCSKVIFGHLTQHMLPFSVLNVTLTKPSSLHLGSFPGRKVVDIQDKYSLLVASKCLLLLKT